MLRKALRDIAHTFGIEISRYHAPGSTANFPSDISDSDREILAKIAPYSMTSVERKIALIHAVEYLVQSGTAGCFVECGVWRGGSSMAAALALTRENVLDRDLYLYDTFEGMTPPTNDDRISDGTTARALMDATPAKSDEGVWCVADIEDVRQNMASTGYPADRIHLLKGPVEATIPAHAPQQPIALLRLDTDWYESTRHELEHLFPLLVEGGILIIDDYGHWTGARRAVDEFLAMSAKKYYMHRIDYTGRLLIKSA